ncbi:hypothetical protein [Paracoccus sp. (in: a-proteobacteria)]|uniref:hypothetical protein n=1 Tax=Paracoccus sp. TaxID=267 RepID=UPI0028974462|nr:hypothetical protein [Paracoccus sp. (in: a-proteobacteria)]
MLSYTVLAVTAMEASDYLGAAGVAVVLHETDLLRGQRHIAARFNARWTVQFDADSVPDPVKWAIIEAAVIEQRAPGSLSPVSTPSTDKVLVAAGKLQWERVKGAGGADSYIPRIAAVEGLLGPLTRSSNTTFLLRA